MRNSKYITAERLEEIAAITPATDDDAPEITGAEATRARFAHESHPEWYLTVQKSGIYQKKTIRM